MSCPQTLYPKLLKIFKVASLVDGIITGGCFIKDRNSIKEKKNIYHTFLDWNTSHNIVLVVILIVIFCHVVVHDKKIVVLSIFVICCS